MKKKKLVLTLLLILGVVFVLLSGCSSSIKATITFNTLGGSHVSPVTVTTATETLELPTPKERAGYRFDYWCYDEECTQKVDESVIPEQDVTFYAKWTQLKIAVTFIGEGKKQYVFVPYGEDLLVKDMPEVPEKEGHTGAWDTTDLLAVKSEITVNAVYTVASYTINYMVQNKVYFSTEGEPDTAAETPDNPEVAGYIFLGWYYDASFFRPCLELPDRFGTADLTIYSRFVSTEGMEKFFTFSLSGSEVVVTGLTDDGKRENVLVVPSAYNDRPVTAIADGTAEEPTLSSQVLTNLILPGSVRSIGAYAFASNGVLEEIRLSDGLVSIGEYAFCGLPALLSVTVPSSVERIEEGAFSSCENLAEIYFNHNSSLTSFGSRLFAEDGNLLSFVLPDSSERYFSSDALIGSAIETLTSGSDRYLAEGNVVYDENGTVAVACAPAYSSSVALREGCTTVGEKAFADCARIPSVTIPATVTTIGANAFYRCASLLTVPFAVGEQPLSIASHAFAESGLTRISLPANVDEIQDHAFADCDALLSADLTAVTMDELGEYAFADCETLQSVLFGEIGVIGERAFYSCRFLRTVTFPQALVEVGDYAFADCLSMTTVALSANTLQRIGDYAFAGLTGSSTAEVTFYRGLRSLGDYAFMNTLTRVFQVNATTMNHVGVGAYKNCTKLTTVSLPKTATVTTLPKELFYGCTSLTKISIPANYTDLDDFAFYGCTSLLQVEFDTNCAVERIGESCFENCSALGNYGGRMRILPATVTTLGDKAFKNCVALQEITLSANLLTVSKEAFAYCRSLTTILYDQDCLTRAFDENAFAYCTSLTSVRLPEKLALRGTTLEEEPLGAVKNPFYGCTSLSSFSVTGNDDLFVNNGIVYFNEGDYRVLYLYPTGRGGEFSVENDVCGIDDYAFYGARLSGLAFTVYPIVDGVERIVFTRIGNYSFAQSNLTNAVLSKRVYSVGEGAFSGSTLSQVTFDATYIDGANVAYNILNAVENNLLTIGKRAFSNSVITSVLLPARTAALSEGAFADCHSLRSVTFTSGDLTTLTLGKEAFRRDGYLTTLSFPEQLIFIGDYAFADCNNVAELTFSSGEDFSIGDYAFKSNHYLYAVDLPSTLVSLGEGAFADCTRLTDVTVSALGSNITIPDFTFYGDVHLTKIILPGRVKTIGKFAFVRTGLEEISFSATSIDDYAFYQLKSLRTISFPDGLTSIGKYAFAESGLTSFIYGTADLSVFEYAFAYTALTGVVLEENFLFAGTHIFAGTKDLTTLTIKKSGVEIADYTFENSGLSEITGDGTSSFVAVRIGKNAFAWCKNLTSVEVNFPDEAIKCKIDEMAFAESGLTAFCIENTGAADLVIGRAAFFDCHSLKEVTLHSGHGIEIQYDAFRNSAVEILDLSGALTLGVGFATEALSLTEVRVVDLNGVYSFDETAGLYKSEAGGDVLLMYPAGNTESSYYLSPSVKEIAEHAFSGNVSLTTFILPDNEIVVHDTSFGGRTDLIAYAKKTDLSGYEDWPIIVEAYSQNIDGFILRSLGDDRYSIVNYVGDSVVGDTIFVPGLTQIQHGRKVEYFKIESIAEGAFRNKVNFSAVIIGDGIKEVGAYAFADCTSLTNVSFGKNVTVLKEGAFERCPLTSVTFNEDLAVIGPYAFYGCDRLTTVTMPGRLTTIESYAFADCSSLNELNFGEFLTTIGDNAFSNDDGLIDVVLPSSVTSFGNYVFSGCDDLAFVFLRATKVPKLKSVDTFAEMNTGLKLIVPYSAERAYLSDGTWRNYSSGLIGISTEITADAPFYVEDKGIFLSLNETDTRLLCYLGAEPDLDMNADERLRNVAEIGEYAFGAFTHTVVLGNKVTTIAENAFAHAENLESITLPNALKTIGKNAFYSLIHLNEVTIDPVASSLTTIGDYAFYGCENLTSFVLPSKLTSIGNYAFSGETMHLSSVTTAMTSDLSLSIGRYAFANNVDLKELSFDCAVGSFGDGAFSNCYAFGVLYLNSRSSTAPAIASTSTKVFENCDTLAIIVPDDTVRTNYRQTWSSAYDKNRLFSKIRLTESYYDNGVLFEQDGFVVDVPSGTSTVAIVAYIGDKTELTFPSTVRLPGTTTSVTVTKIGRTDNSSNTISNGRVISDAVTKVTIPGTVINIAGDAFRGAKGLTEVFLENGDSSSVLIGNYAFAECENLAKVTLSYNVLSVGQYAFAYCPALNDFRIAEYPSTAVDKNLVTIGTGTFYECTGMTTISFPKHLGSLGAYAFSRASALVTIDFGAESSLSSCGQYCFAYSGLKAITFPGTVTNVGDYAFAGCQNIRSVHLLRTTQDYSSLTTTSPNVFANVSSVFVKVYVPYVNISQYDSAIGWSAKTVIPDLTVGEYNYRPTAQSGTVILTAYLGQDTRVEIPTYVTIDATVCRVATINSYFGNETVEEFVFASDSLVSTLNNYAFAGCASLKRIHLPSRITTLGKYCFANCKSLTDVTLPQGGESGSEYTLDEGVFSGCSSLKEIFVPATAKEIGLTAFYNCSALIRVEVAFGATEVSALGLSAFVNTAPDMVVVVPENRRDAFVSRWEWEDSDGYEIFERKYLFGDFVVKDDNKGGYVLSQYTGDFEIESDGAGGYVIVKRIGDLIVVSDENGGYVAVDKDEPIESYELIVNGKKVTAK